MAIKPPSRTVAEPERARVFGQLAALLNAGMPMERALATLESDHPVANESLQVARQRVRNGHSFAAAAKHGQSFRRRVDISGRRRRPSGPRAHSTQRLVRLKGGPGTQD